MGAGKILENDVEAAGGYKAAKQIQNMVNDQLIDHAKDIIAPEEKK